MPDQRDLNLEQYEISRMAYRELKYFCLQYEEKKKKLSELRGLAAAPISGGPRGSSVSRPTEQRALRAVALARDCELIEQTALEAAGPVMYRSLMKNVTQGVPYYCLDVPCGKNQFTALRRKFFWRLNEKRR